MGAREDRTEIEELLVRYATGIDSRDWPLFRSCFTEDLEADYDTLGPIAGAERITDIMQKAHDPMGPSFHRMSNMVVKIDGDTAAARTYVHAVLLVDPADKDKWVDVVGSYDDKLVRTPDGWRIANRVSRTARQIAHGFGAPTQEEAAK
jgi:3-phenylpropionate/cinnamic acid dioxygenase small subunit